MRDPLSRVPVRFKLPLTFVLLTSIALGLGGYVTSRLAQESLREQIQFRLDEKASAVSSSVERSLETLRRRVDDFASDGHLRQETGFLVAGARGPRDGATRSVQEALAHYLDREKLTLVGEFADAFLLDPSGKTLLVARRAGGSPAVEADATAPWVGPIHGPTPGAPFPWFVLSTPIRRIEGGEGLGRLQVVVRADAWAANLVGAPEFAGATGFQAALVGKQGYVLALAPPVPSTAVPGRDPIRFSRLLPGTLWRLDLAVDGRTMTVPVDSLLWKFRYLGLAFVALTVVVLFFPRQFLLKPLAALQDAAGRIAAGDFSARVECASNDEVGALGRAFNVMAGAVEERTRTLEATAETLARREADIRFERDRLNAVIRSMEDGLFILDREGRVTLANAAARPVLQAISRVGHGENRLHCEKSRNGTFACMDCIAQVENEVQACVIRVDARVYEINGAVLAGGRETVAGRVFVSRDVTDRIRESERLAHQERLSVLGEIAAVMAHELNNPLAAISMFSQMLLKGLDSGSALRPHAEVIHRNTESCKATIRSLLDMATTPTAAPEEFDVRDLVEDVIQLLEPVAHRAGVTLSCGGHARRPVLYGDELQLRQAVVNLVMNGIQSYGAGRGGTVRLSTHDRDDRLVVAVEDDGPGIPPEIREHIFEPFFTSKPPGEGTGLGLPTSRRIVEAHGGTLALVDAAPGRTRFEVVVPRQGVGRADRGGRSTPEVASVSRDAMLPPS